MTPDPDTTCLVLSLDVIFRLRDALFEIGFKTNNEILGQLLQRYIILNP